MPLSVSIPCRSSLALLVLGLGADPASRPEDERVLEYHLGESLEGVCGRASRYGRVAPRFEHVAASVRAGLDWIESASRSSGRPLRFVERGTTDVEASADDGVHVFRFGPGASGVDRGRVGHALRTDLHVRDGEFRGFGVTLYGTDVRWHVASSAGWNDETDLCRRLCHDLGFALGLPHREVWMNGLACLDREPICRKEQTRRDFDLAPPGRPRMEGRRIVLPEWVGDVLPEDEAQAGAAAFRVRTRGVSELLFELWDARAPDASALAAGQAPTALGAFAHSRGGTSGSFVEFDGEASAEVLLNWDWSGRRTPFELVQRASRLRATLRGYGTSQESDEDEARWREMTEPAWILTVRPRLEVGPPAQGASDER